MKNLVLPLEIKSNGKIAKCVSQEIKTYEYVETKEKILCIEEYYTSNDNEFIDVMRCYKNFEQIKGEKEKCNEQ